MFHIEREHKKSTLMSMKKEELVERIMFLEHNNNVLHERIEIQARNVEKFLKKEWIPCSKRLPEEFKNVLATNATGFICIAKRSGESWYEDAGFGRVYIDAWMPLPTPYREDGERNG